MDQDNQAQELRMTFDPNTIQHLGIKMYSNLPAAIAELVANAYDACSPEIKIKLYDDGEKRSIVVEDKGIGMSFDEINSQFLIIGRNRRDEGMKEAPCERIASGKKGLGKLALFGIGGQIDIETTKLDEPTSTKLSLVWEDLKNWDTRTQGSDYKPTFEVEESDKNINGTKITISLLKRRSEINQFYINNLAVSLSKLFNFLDDDFQASISLNDGEEIAITNELRYENTERQFEWKFPEYAENIDSDYDKKTQITGMVFTTPRPLPNKKQTGITLFAHGRCVNLPEFFGHTESSNFFSYATGWLNVDFVDDYDEELISTDRKSIDWEHEDMILLRAFLKTVVGKIHFDWRARRKKDDKEKVVVNSGIDIQQWLDTLPEDKAKTIDEALEKVSDPDSDKNPVDVLFETSHELAPEYAEKHWRYLHEKIKNNEPINRLYRQKNYFQATSEAVKLYINEVRDVSGIRTEQILSDYSLMGQAFGTESTKPISLTDRADRIEKDIEHGQMHYSQGVVMGFKNPVTSHATEASLKERGLFSEKDCLNVLSLLSHLFDRLERRAAP